MSTYIAKVKGVFQEYDPKNQLDIINVPADIHVTRFYGGHERGVCIQLSTIQLERASSYIQLTKEQCEELSKILLECFDYDKYPSE